MPGGRICKICADSRRMKLATELIAAGRSDQDIADRVGLAGTAGRMVVNRHRRNHIEAPARAVAAAASKGRANVEQRQQLVAAAEAGDTAAAFLALNQIASDLRRVQERLERTADAAEVDNQRLAVASLSGQQLRAAEVRAKLGGVGSYATPRTDKPSGAPFVLNINFSGGRTTRIEGTPVHPDDFDAIPPPYQNSLPVAPAGDFTPPTADEDDGDLDEDV